MRRGHVRTLATAAVAVACFAACPSSLPQVITDGGTKVSKLPLRSERSAAGTSRIFALLPLDSDLLVVNSEGAVTFDGSGRPIRSTPFLPEAVRNPVAVGQPEGPALPAFAAHVFKLDELVLYGPDGEAYASAPLDFKYAQGLVVADLVGDSDREVVIASAGAKQLDIYDAQGNLLRSPRSPFSINAFDAHDLFGDEKEELIVNVYPNEAGKETFFFLDGRGRNLREWDYGVVSDFDVVFRDGVPILATHLDGSYRLLDLEGRELERFEAPLGDYFADLHAAPWRGGWVFVGSGSGYHPYHMISVYDEAGELVYQETGSGWSKAMAVPDPQGTEFFVAKGAAFWRYSLDE